MYKSTTTSTYKNIKKVRIQTEDKNGKYRSVNKYYVNGKLVTKHDRFIAESTIESNAPRDEVVTTYVSNFPVH
tara:strand:- start:283 stop:501 length:219 start_codon:yes stop_codon:yes gene_type:complete